MMPLGLVLRTYKKAFFSRFQLRFSLLHNPALEWKRTKKILSSPSLWNLWPKCHLCSERGSDTTSITVLRSVRGPAALDSFYQEPTDLLPCPFFCHIKLLALGKAFDVVYVIGCECAKSIGQRVVYSSKNSAELCAQDSREEVLVFDFIREHFELFFEIQILKRLVAILD